jgi:hypothetical protein
LIPLRPRFFVATAAISVLLIAARHLLNTEEHFGPDTSSLRGYIAATSTLFGLLAAFTIYVVWEQFIDADRAAKLESKELLDLCRYAAYLNDPAALAALTAAVSQYAETICDDEWETMPEGKAHPAAEKALQSVFEAVNSVRFDDPRDSTAWGRMIEKFESASDARDKRIERAGERMPRLMRWLLYLASGVLLLGFFMLAVQSDFLAWTITIAITSVVVLTIDVAEDIDNPFDGHWAISRDSFIELRAQLPKLFREEKSRV